MLTLSFSVILIAAVVATGELLHLYRQRRLLLLDRQRQQFFVDYMRDGAKSRTSALPAAEAPASLEAARQIDPVAVADPAPKPAAPSRHTAREEGVVYVEAGGRCTFANEVARTLLHWSGGDLALGDVLGGGGPESTELLRRLAEQGVVEHYATTLAGPLPLALEVSGVAFRDRDDNLWGAALFIRRQPAAAAQREPASALSQR